MKKISSKSTKINKRMIPIIWFGGLTVIVLVTAVVMWNNREWHTSAFIFPALMAIIGYILMKHLIFTLMDEVWDKGDSLLAKNQSIEENIAFSNIMNVSYSLMNNPPRVTLTLREPCCFGKDVSFIPPLHFNPFKKNPLVVELIEKIDANRCKQ